LVCDSSGLVLNSGDCDDSNSQIYPGAAEDCDGVDNDCDLSVDEDTTIQTWYPDADGDGYGVDGATVSDCTAPAGYAATNDDCDDNDSDRYPYSYERKTSDGQDNDCDSWTDEYDVPAGMSLNSAIAFSSRGGLIVLEDGSYTLTSGGAFQGGTIEIYGSNSSNVVIDLSQSTYFGSVSSSTLVLGGLTLTGGTGYQGSYGIIEVTGGTLELEDVVFDSNSTGFRGGAIGIDSGSLVATDCRFTGNSSGSYAGAIYLGSGASASLTRCIFDQNTASYGGAISTDSNSTLSIENAIFANNTANFGGSLDLDGTNTLSYITFVGNTASSAASAIWGTCDTTATGLVFYDNSNYAVNVCSSFSMSYSLYGTSDLYGGSWVDAGGNLWGANGYSASFSSYSADGVYNDDLRLTGDGVDQADPSCSDVDGSRCDMGAYGGPNAW
jgi:predicted outer membrane repeat protein